MGIDPAWGSSTFGIVITALVDVVKVLYAEEYNRPDYNEMLQVVFELIRKYSNIGRIYIDSPNPSFIRSLKIQLDEDPDYEKAITRYKSEGLGSEEDWIRGDLMRVIPVNFHTDHKEMLGHIAINPKFDKLVTALRTPVDSERDTRQRDDIL